MRHLIFVQYKKNVVHLKKLVSCAQNEAAFGRIGRGPHMVCIEHLRSWHAESFQVRKCP